MRREGMPIPPEAAARNPEEVKPSEKKENKELRGKLDLALAELRKISAQLPDGSSEKKRVEHTISSMGFVLSRQGRDGAPVGEHQVSVEGRPGNMTEPYKQYEGVPVDEAIDILKRQAEKVRAEASKKLTKQEIRQLEAAREAHNKRYQEAFRKADAFRATPLTSEAGKKAMEKAFAEAEAVGKKYKEFNEYLKNAKAGKVSKEADELNNLAETLYENSRGYFEKHYGKSSGELTPEEQQRQDLRTRKEAYFVSKDRHRATGSEEGDYRRGMEDLNKRRELDLAEEAEPKPTVLNEKLGGEAVKSGQEEEKPLVKHEQEPKSEEKAMVLREKMQPAERGEQRVTVPEKGKKTIYMVDISEIAKRMAWTKAEEQLRQKFEGSGWFMRNIGRGLAENFYRLKYYQDALKEIEQDNNLRKAIEGRLTGDAKKAAAGGDYYRILDSVIEQYENDLAEAGNELGEKITGNPELGIKSAELFYRHQQDKWDDLGDEFKGKKGREAVELFVKKYLTGDVLKDAKWAMNENGEKVRDEDAKGKLYASNFYGMAEGYKEFIKAEIEKAEKEHGPENREAILKHVEGVMNLEFQLGLKQRDLLNNKPKGTLGRFERALDWSEKHKTFGRIVVNPFTFGVIGGTLAGAGGRRLGKLAIAGGLVGTGIATSFAAPLIAGAALGGALRWYKRSKDLKYDIAQERRHETLGGKGSELLDKAGGLRHATMKLREAIETVNGLHGKAEFGEDDKKSLAEIIGRLEMEAGTRTDLFIMDEAEGQKFGTTEVPKTELRVALNKVLEEQGLGSLKKLNKEFSDKFVAEVTRAVAQDINAKEKNFDKFRRSEAFKSAVKGAVLGIAGGVVGQYALNKGLGAVAEKMQWAGMADYFRHHGTTLEKLVGQGAHPAAVEHQLAQHPWETTRVGGGAEAHAATEAPSVGGVRPAMSPDQWKNFWGVGDVRHHDWHDEAGSHGLRNLLFEGKQQQLYLNPDTGGGVSVNVHDMLDNLKNNFSDFGKPGNIFGKSWDESVDSMLKDLFPKHLEQLAMDPNTTEAQLRQALEQFSDDIHNNLKVRIIPTEAMNKAGEGIVVGNVDSSGNLQLPGNIRQAFFDSSGRQLCKYLEVGYEDEQGHFHTFATSEAEGEGVFPEVPTEPVEASGDDSFGPIKRDDWALPLIMPHRKIYRRLEQKKKGKVVSIDSYGPTPIGPGREPRQITAGAGGNLPAERGRTEVQGRPEVNSEQARAATDRVAKAANEGTDEELEAAIGEMQDLFSKHKISNPETQSYMSSTLLALSPEVQDRIKKASEKLNGEQEQAAPPEKAARSGFAGGGGGGSAEGSVRTETSTGKTGADRAGAKENTEKAGQAAAGEEKKAETNEPSGPVVENGPQTVEDETEKLRKEAEANGTKADKWELIMKSGGLLDGANIKHQYKGRIARDVVEDNLKAIVNFQSPSADDQRRMRNIFDALKTNDGKIPQSGQVARLYEELQALSDFMRDASGAKEKRNERNK